MKLDDSYLARRRFLHGMLGGGAAAMGAGVAGPLALYSGNLRAEPPPPSIVLAESQWRLTPGKSKMILYGRIPALLIQTPLPDSRLKAFVATCTHFDCTVGYREQENHIACACHGGLYDLEGNVLAGPPPRPLRALYHRVQDGKLILALEKENLEKIGRRS
jgi:cytochrome b6-f complex iron-sulfur subunit